MFFNSVRCEKSKLPPLNRGRQTKLTRTITYTSMGSSGNLRHTLPRTLSM